MLDAGLDDTEKERAVQQAGLSLLKLSWQIAWRILLALGAVAVPIVLADVAGLAPRDDSLGVLLRLDFIVGISVLAIALGWLLRKRRAPDEQATGTAVAETSAYNAGDRLMHALAFSGPGVQKALARIDDRLYRRDIARVPDAAPIFITSLARGGTTALLNALNDTPGVATHLYRDMPFMTAPMLWSRLSGNRRDVTERARAHGDGMMISLDSPEAFDEIFWMLFWPEKYRRDHIALWHQGDTHAQAQAFFATHFRKIARLRHPELREGAQVGVRYLSKNNANIARLALLRDLFPGCQIVIPLREPSAHAASLFRQHQNFSRLHAQDGFAKRYMRDIGHLEFGALHRPIDFDRAALAGHTPDQPDYWLAYWVTCFHHVSRFEGAAILVAQDDLRQSPARTMDALIDQLALPVGDPAPRWENYFRSGADAPMDEMFDANLLAEARATYHHLHASSLRHQGQR